MSHEESEEKPRRRRSKTHEPPELEEGQQRWSIHGDAPLSYDPDEPKEEETEQ